MEAKFMNAKQVYDAYGIARSTLARLASEGRVLVKSLTDGQFTLKIYRVADIEKVINGVDENANA